MLTKHTDLYALMLLLLNEKGVKSYAELQTVGGVVKTHREAAKDRGLIHSADDVDQIIQEMMLFECGTPNQCELFALVLVWHDVGDARELWAQNWLDMCATEVRMAKSEADKVKAHNHALILVEDTLEHFRVNAKTYMLDYMVSDTATPSTVAVAATPKEIEQETNYDTATGQQLHDELGNLNE